ncbi:hypothetical protein QWY93_04440 [Echinicola jeungdonensis]|uniref:ATP synthase protein I n=1 Tax=Echinicola jeungdonensis TaxID=709343 RepID=A0ABV5J3H3_9BACT|nr:hypothetical protein [Echinicola jeungdonensis]MDN3668571.1 hypothetical protein [Echinicola jeungdonensis]
MKIFQSQTGQLVVYSVFVIGLALFIQQIIQPQWVHDKIWQIIGFYFGLVLLSGLITQKLIKSNKENSVNAILGATVFRFFASLLFITVFIWRGVDDIVLFVVNFFVIYLLYLLFDIYGLIANLRAHSK